MRQRVIFFLVVLVLMFSGESFGQQTFLSISEKHSSNLKSIQKSIDLLRMDDKSFPFALPKDTIIQVRYLWVLKPDCYGSKWGIEPTYIKYVKQLGYFCQKELQLDKLTPLPIRFRLGSLDYVNWMEQKPNAIKPR
jgi:hypothetical protein